jgi:hypothetical protein
MPAHAGIQFLDSGFRRNDAASRGEFNPLKTYYNDLLIPLIQLFKIRISHYFKLQAFCTIIYYKLSQKYSVSVIMFCIVYFTLFKFNGLTLIKLSSYLRLAVLSLIILALSSRSMVQNDRTLEMILLLETASLIFLSICPLYHKQLYGMYRRTIR